MGSITNVVISRDERPQLRGGDLLIPLRVPWYRSLPYSSLEHLVITVDGTQFSDDDVVLEIGDDVVPFARLAEVSDRFWFVQDTGWARVPWTLDGPSTIDVRVVADFRIPYILMAPTQAIVRHVVQDEKLTIEGEH